MTTPTPPPSRPRAPPKFVPTLTEVVAGEKPRTATGPSVSTGGIVPTAASAKQGAGSLPPELMEDQIVHRVMQRIDVSLDRRLREAVAKVTLERTRGLGPMLRQEIESVVRRAVTDALAEELAARDGNSRPG